MPRAPPKTKAWPTPYQRAIVPQLPETIALRSSPNSRLELNHQLGRYEIILPGSQIQLLGFLRLKTGIEVAAPATWPIGIGPAPNMKHEFPARHAPIEITDAAGKTRRACGTCMWFPKFNKNLNAYTFEYTSSGNGDFKRHHGATYDHVTNIEILHNMKLYTIERDPYKCTTTGCKAAFNRGDKLAEHRRDEHGENTPLAPHDNTAIKANPDNEEQRPALTSVENLPSDSAESQPVENPGLFPQDLDDGFDPYATEYNPDDLQEVLEDMHHSSEVTHVLLFSAGEMAAHDPLLALEQDMKT